MSTVAVESQTLDGAALNFAAALALGMEPQYHLGRVATPKKGFSAEQRDLRTMNGYSAFNPLHYWNHLGPIVDSGDFTTDFDEKTKQHLVKLRIPTLEFGKSFDFPSAGKSFARAVLLCLVRSRFGEMVLVPQPVAAALARLTAKAES